MQPKERCRMTRRLKAVLLVVTFSGTVAAQSGSRGPLEGAWRVTEIVVTGADASNTPNPQPGLFIFTRTYYSFFWVPGNQPRALFKAEDPTTAEKVAAFDSLVGNTGRYEMSGSTLTARPMVARFQNCMGGGFHEVSVPT
jgi:hypothetical protein